MSLNILINSILIIIGGWLALAYLIGSIRFAFRPLILMGLSCLLVCVGSILHLISISDYNSVFFLALVGSLVFNFKYRAAWNNRGITNRELLFFRHHS